MTSDKPQSQSLSLPFCKMGHTSHHEALNSQLLILLCVGTDPRSFLTLGPVSSGSGWPSIQVHILSTFSRPLARPMNLAYSFGGFVTFPMKPTQGPEVKQPYCGCGLRTSPGIVTEGREPSSWATLFFFCRAVLGRPSCGQHPGHQQRQPCESCCCL